MEKANLQQTCVFCLIIEMNYTRNEVSFTFIMQYISTNNKSNYYTCVATSIHNIESELELQVRKLADHIDYIQQ